MRAAVNLMIDHQHPPIEIAGGRRGYTRRANAHHVRQWDGRSLLAIRLLVSVEGLECVCIRCRRERGVNGMLAGFPQLCSFVAARFRKSGILAKTRSLSI